MEIKRKIVKISIGVILFLLGNSIIAQDTLPAHFVGTYDKNEGNKKGMCSDRGMEHFGIMDITEYEMARKKFYEEHKGQSPSSYFLATNESAIVYEFDKDQAGYNCKVKVVGVQKSSSVENAQELLNKKELEAPNTYLTKPKTIFTWTGYGKSLDVKEVNHDGVVTKYILYKKPGGKNITILKFKNTHKEEEAVVAIIANNKTQARWTIAPGEIVTTKTEFDDYNVEVYFQNKKEEKTDVTKEVLESIKRTLIKWSISTKDGKIKEKTSTSSGVRG